MAKPIRAALHLVIYNPYSNQLNKIKDRKMDDYMEELNFIQRHFFNGPDDNAIYKKISTLKYTFPENKWRNVSNEAKDLITHMIWYKSQ